MKWSEFEYCSSFVQLQVGRLNVSWDTSHDTGLGYSATAFGRKLVAKFPTIDEAQAGAERAAMQLLRASIAELEDDS